VEASRETVRKKMDEVFEESGLATENHIIRFCKYRSGREYIHRAK